MDTMRNTTPYEAATHLIRVLGIGPGMASVRTHWSGEGQPCLVVTIHPSSVRHVAERPSSIDGYEVLYDVQEHPSVYRLH